MKNLTVLFRIFLLLLHTSVMYGVINELTTLMSSNNKYSLYYFSPLFMGVIFLLIIYIVHLYKTFIFLTRKNQIND